MKINLVARLPALTAILLSLTLATRDVLGESSSSSHSSSIRDLKLEGDALLAKGEYLGASRAYSNAIDLDPTSFNLHYLRATTYLSQGRHQLALTDFTKLLQLKPDFHQAHLQRARILAKEGDFEQAQKELGVWLKTDKGKGDEEAKELSHRLADAIRSISIAYKAQASKDWPAVIEATSTALLVGPNAIPLRTLRLEAYEHLADSEGYVGDLSRLTTLQPSSASHSLKLAYHSYLVQNEPTRAGGYVKQALHFDPDSAPHRRVHKLVRSVEKQVAQARNFVEGGNYREAIKVLLGTGSGSGSSPGGLIALVKESISTATPAFIPTSFSPLTSSQLLLELYRLTLKSYLALGLKNTAELEKYADLVLSMRGGEGDIDALTARGEVFEKKEMWEEAVRAFNEAFEKSGRSSRDIMNRLQKAQRLLKQSKAKDYYKVLGVSRDADLKTIKKAFRKKAKENHPDIGGSEEKMAQINEAYETLSNPELRERFDNGDDPNDPMANAGGGGGGPFQGNPFGGNPFGGGGRQFHFQQGGFPGGGFPGGGGRTQFHWG